MQTGRSVRECPSTGKHVDGLNNPVSLVSCSLTPPAPDLDVRLGELDVDAHCVEQFAQLLSRDERERATRFHFARDRRCYTVARAMLRMLLAEKTGLSPAAVVFAQTQYGKPYMVDAPADLHFNVSHAAERAVFALASGSLPGIDIEHLQRNIDHDAIAAHYFAPREYADLQRISAAHRKHAFLAAWTCKEAIAKAIGQGLSLPLQQIEIAVCADAGQRLLNVPCGPLSDWSIYSANAGADYVATVAVYRGPESGIAPAPAVNIS